MSLILLLFLWLGQGQESPAKGQSPANTQQQPTQSEPGPIPQLDAGHTGDKRQDDQDHAGKWSDPMVLLTVLLVVGVFVTAAIYYGQLKKMRETVSLVGEQRDTMRDQLDAMVKQAEHAEAQVKIMKETLVETKRIFDLTERPIIVATDCDIKGGLAPNRPLRPIVTFVNKGRTAAQRFKVTVEIAAKPKYIWWFGFGDTGKVPAGDYFLPAGDPMLLVGAPADAATIDVDFYKRVAEGKEEFVVHGKGSYEDLAGREYPIEYAFQFHADGGFAHYGIRKIGETEENEKENPN